MKTITPKMNEKRIAEIPKVRWDTAYAFKIARRAIREATQKPLFMGVNYEQSNN